MPESIRSRDLPSRSAVGDVIAPAAHKPIPLLTARAGNDASCAPTGSDVYEAARAQRAAMQAALLRNGCRALVALASRVWKRYRQHRQTRAIYHALHALDDRTLRDLGFHRSEILSVAAEATGEAERTRRVRRAAGW